MTLKQAIKEEARRLGFPLVGVTTPEPPSHLSVYERWLEAGHHGDMRYLESERARARRADPRLVLPGCRSMLVLGIPYVSPLSLGSGFERGAGQVTAGRIAAYAWGDDYHLVLPGKLKALVGFIEAQVGHVVANRYYTDTGPLLERDLAQRAGLGWIGRNTCLLNPQFGSFFFLAEILLGIDLEPDPPFPKDHCGTCTRCIEACPTNCILPDRTLDARRCISYLTIENKAEIPLNLRPDLGNWIFGCDVCQVVCPWNRFAAQDVEASFSPRPATGQPDLLRELRLSSEDFRNTFKHTPVERAKRRGYLRNVAVALGNTGGPEAIPALQAALDDPEVLVREHAVWALERIQVKKQMQRSPKLLLATNNSGKLKEIQAILRDLDIELVQPSELGLALEVNEDGLTYAENAAKKALAFAMASGMVSLADDSGLEVQALDGQPGLYSNRFGRAPFTDANRRAYLLEKLEGKPRPWAAAFRAKVAVASPGGIVRFAEGICRGEIIPHERGEGGFGYDPLFYIPEAGETMAELDMETKNRLSHRGQAVRNAIPFLIEFLRLG